MNLIESKKCVCASPLFNSQIIFATHIHSPGCSFYQRILPHFMILTRSLADESSRLGLLTYSARQPAFHHAVPVSLGH
jgi:hypothetical protein